jgi:hypothetical protein
MNVYVNVTYMTIVLKVNSRENPECEMNVYVNVSYSPYMTIVLKVNRTNLESERMLI